MFSKFSTRLSSDTDIFSGAFWKYRRIGSRHLSEQEKNFSESLDDFVEDGVISAEKLEQGLYPSVRADVFLSHSGRDIDVVLAFAGWLYQNFGLRSFVNETVWDQSCRMFKILDEACGGSNEADIPYESLLMKTKRTCRALQKRWSMISSHADMILSTALLKMIDRTEAFFVINPGRRSNPTGNRGTAQTDSPWIYSEVLYSSIIRRKPLSEYRNYGEAFLREDLQLALESLYFMTVTYNLDMKGVVHLAPGKLEQWRGSYELQKLHDTSMHQLDALYEITEYKSEMKATQNLYRYLPPERVTMLRSSVHSLDEGQKSFINEHMSMAAIRKFVREEYNSEDCPLCGKKLPCCLIERKR